jgi:hypothetical protein
MGHDVGLVPPGSHGIEAWGDGRFAMGRLRHGGCLCARMRIWMILVLALSACADDDTTSGGTLRRNNGTAAPGAGNVNGEHGSNAPGGATTAPDPGTTVATETWANGKSIASNVNIGAGAIVTIAPGATVSVAKGVAITVTGTLKTTPTSKITGAGWTGIVIARGATLEADGLTVEGADSALWPQTGNAKASFANGTIIARTPFKMENGSTLSISRTKVTATDGSAIAGTFSASYMEYDKGTAGGLTLSDPAGSMTISDSILRGAGGGDYVISSAGKLVKLEYSTISGSHCGLHFSGVDQFILDHVSDDTNSYGAMLYGSGAGPHTITASNVRSTQVDLDMQGTNGPLTITGSYTTGKNTLAANATLTGARDMPIADAKPR